MSKYYYAQMHIAALDDVKLARLPDNLWRRFWEVILMARECSEDGITPIFEDMVWRLHADEAKLVSELDDLTARGFLVEHHDAQRWSVKNFARYQSRSKNAERQAAYRARRRDAARQERREAAAVEYEELDDASADSEPFAGLASELLYFWIERVGTRLPQQSTIRRREYMQPILDLLKHPVVNYSVATARQLLTEKHDAMLAAGYTPKRPRAIIEPLLADLDAQRSPRGKRNTEQQRAASRSAIADALSDLTE